MKIAIFGHSGSGKSTLAARFGRYYHIPVLHLDSVNFEPNWVVKDKEKARAEVRAFMDANDAWVIDGSYRGFYMDERMEQADRIIYLNFPRSVCLPRAFGRYLKYRGRTRADMGEGCNEKFDWEFFTWIMFTGRKKQKLKQFDDICAKYPQKVKVFRAPKQLDNWLKAEKII